MHRFIILVFALAFIACGQDKKPAQAQSDFQREMNAMFKDATTSPLSEEDLKSFEGLDFFDVDSTFVVTARLERTPDTEFFPMKTTTDRISHDRVFGVLHFEVEGQALKLNIYQNKENLETEGLQDHLFLPFLDATNGVTTYGGGRYIDLSIPAGDSLVVDFNKAYNPYCVYNEKFSCPLVPRANYLPVEIKAGLKDYKKH